jgi:hypothetical protein
MAKALKDSHVFLGLGQYEHLPNTDLIVLDSEEVEDNARWRLLTQSSDSVAVG